MKAKLVVAMLSLSLFAGAQSIVYNTPVDNFEKLRLNEEESLGRYDAEYCAVTNMQISLVNKIGFCQKPVRLRVLSDHFKRFVIIDITNLDQRHEKAENRNILKMVKRSVLNASTSNFTDLCIIDMNDNVVLKSNLFWTKTAKVDISMLSAGYYMVCYFDKTGFISKKLIIK